MRNHNFETANTERNQKYILFIIIEQKSFLLYDILWFYSLE